MVVLFVALLLNISCNNEESRELMPELGINGTITVFAATEVMEKSSSQTLQFTAVDLVEKVTFTTTEDFEISLDNSVFTNETNGAASNGSKALNGTVIEIASIPDSIKRTFSATIALNEKQDHLYPGKVVNVRIADQTLDNNSICLPASALVSRQNITQVTKIVDSKAERVDVNVIKQGRNHICVLGDIKINDTVIVAGSAFIHDGKVVENIISVRGS